MTKRRVLLFLVVSHWAFSGVLDPIPTATFVRSPGTVAKVIDRVQEHLKNPDEAMKVFAKKYASKNEGLNHPSFIVREDLRKELETKFERLQKTAETPDGAKAYYHFIASLRYASQQSEQNDELEASLILRNFFDREKPPSPENLSQTLACQLFEAWTADPSFKAVEKASLSLAGGLRQNRKLFETWTGEFKEGASLTEFKAQVADLLTHSGFKKAKELTLPLHLRFRPVFLLQAVPPAGETSVEMTFELNSAVVNFKPPHGTMTVPFPKGSGVGRFKIEGAPDFRLPIEGFRATFEDEVTSLRPELIFGREHKDPSGWLREKKFLLKTALASYLYEALPRSALGINEKTSQEAALKKIENTVSESPCLKNFPDTFKYERGEWRSRPQEGH